jgi:hypothetical protein
MRHAERPGRAARGRLYQECPRSAGSGAGREWDDAIARAVWGRGFVLATVSVTLPVIDYVVDRATRRAPGAKENIKRCAPISASSKARRGKEINDNREARRADARGSA